MIYGSDQSLDIPGILLCTPVYACVSKRLMFTAKVKCLEHPAVVGELKVSSQKGSFLE